RGRITLAALILVLILTARASFARRAIGARFVFVFAFALGFNPQCDTKIVGLRGDLDAVAGLEIFKLHALAVTRDLRLFGDLVRVLLGIGHDKLPVAGANLFSAMCFAALPRGT